MTLDMVVVVVVVMTMVMTVMKLRLWPEYLGQA